VRSVVQSYLGPPRESVGPGIGDVEPTVPLPVIEAGRAVALVESGGVAQLGERLVCNQEAIGSIPFTSTNFRP
jgi:hypothetical protein